MRTLSVGAIHFLRAIGCTEEDIAKIALDENCYDEYQVEVHEAGIHVLEPRGEYNMTWSELYEEATA